MGASLNGLAFGALNVFRTTIGGLFLGGIFLGLLKLLLVGPLAVLQKLRRRSFPEPERLPQVTVLIPAFNEEKVIVKTLRSLLASTYPNFEIMVVDDGSTDDTYQTVVETFGKEPRVQIYSKPNRGKAAALNFGILRAKGEIIVTLDAQHSVWFKRYREIGEAFRGF